MEKITWSYNFCVEVSGVSQRSSYNMAKIILLDQLLLHKLTYQNIVHKKQQWMYLLLL